MSNPSNEQSKIIPTTPNPLPSSSFTTPAKFKSISEQQRKRMIENKIETETESHLDPVNENENENENENQNQNENENIGNDNNIYENTNQYSNSEDEMRQNYDLNMINMQEQMNQMRYQLEQTQQQNAYLQYQQRIHYHPPPSNTPISSSSFIKNVAKPEYFNGDFKSNPVCWIKQILEYMVLTGIPPNFHVSFAASYLREQSRVWWYSLTSEEKIKNQEFSQFSKLLLDKYQPVDQSRIARTNLKSLKQIGSVSSYNNAFTNIIQMINDMSNADKIYHYVNGLKYNIQDRILLEAFENLPDAMNAACKFDILTYNRNSNTNKFTSKNYANNNNNNNYNYNNINSNETRRNNIPIDVNNITGTNEQQYQHQDNEPEGAAFGYENENINVNAIRFTKLTDAERELCRKQGKCFRCRTHGHMANVCPLNKNPGSGSNNYSGSVPSSTMKPSGQISKKW